MNRDKVSKEKISFVDAVKSLMAGKCESFYVEGDEGPIVLSDERLFHNFPVLVFKHTKSPIAAEYLFRSCFLVGEKVETTKKNIVNYYAVNRQGNIVGGPFATKAIPLNKGDRFVEVGGEVEVTVPKKTKVKHVLKDVTWERTGVINTSRGLSIVHFLYTDKEHVFGNLNLPAKGKTTLTIEYEE
jgi:hypothetical protein